MRGFLSGLALLALLTACGGGDESSTDANPNHASGTSAAGTGHGGSSAGHGGQGNNGGIGGGASVGGTAGTDSIGGASIGGTDGGSAGLGGADSGSAGSSAEAGAGGLAGAAGEGSGGATSGGTSGTSGGEAGASAGGTNGGGGTGAAGSAPTNAHELSWTFEEQATGTDSPTGTTIADASGGGLTGVTKGALSWAQGLLAGATAAEADGAASVALLADASPLAIAASDSFRLEVSFRTDVHGQDGEGGAGTLVALEDASSGGFRLSVEGGHLVFRSGKSALTGKTLVSDGRWHRATAIRDRSTSELVLVVDGAFVDRTADSSANLPATGGFFALGRADGSQPFVGAVDGVRFVRERLDAPPEATPYAVSTVFTRDAEPVPGAAKKYVLERLPAIVRSQKGTLLAFAEGRVDGAEDFGNIDVVLKRSTDGGKTWSSLIRALDVGADKAGNPIPFVVGGKLVVLSTIDPATPCNNCDYPRQFFVVTSEDDGLTWTKPKEVTKSVAKAGWDIILVGPGHGTILTQGPLAGSLVVAAKHRSNGVNGSHVLLSSDGGDSWSIASSDESSGQVINESASTELPGGGFFINARLGVPFDEANRVKGTRAVAHLSPSLAYTDSPTFARTNVFRGPIVYGNVLGRRGSERLGDEARTFFSFPAGEHGTNFGIRHDLRVYASRDEALSWSAGKRVVGGWAAYSDLIALDGSAVGVLVETNATDNPGSQNPDSGIFSNHVDYVRTTAEWLDERTMASFAFEGHAPGGKLGNEKSSGDLPLSLSTKGNVALVTGRHHSTAARFDGQSSACVSATSSAGWLDFGRFDTFAVEATFRTKSHGQGTPVGTLLSRTGVGSSSAFWLRVEGGKIRFAIGSCYAGVEESNCGIVPGACSVIEKSSSCNEKILTAPTIVSDGAWHRVRAVRDGKSGKMTVLIDGKVVAETTGAAGEFVKNEHPLCLGSFADGSRAFEGDIDVARVELTD